MLVDNIVYIKSRLKWAVLCIPSKLVIYFATVADSSVNAKSI